MNRQRSWRNIVGFKTLLWGRVRYWHYGITGKPILDFVKFSERFGAKEIGFQSLVPPLNFPSFLRDSRPWL